MNQAGAIDVRRVKIVATLGPATSTPESIRGLVQAGVGVFRFNFSHGTHEEHARVFKTVRTVAAELGRQIAILQDLQGPRIRTGETADGEPTNLVPGKEVIIAGTDAAEQGQLVIGYPQLHSKVAPGNRILLDDGRMELMVEAISGKNVRCRVVKGGLVGPNKGVNLPGIQLGIPSFTSKDIADLELGLDLGVDMIAVSFVQSGEDARPVRRVLKQHRVSVPLLAKIEKPEALDNLSNILRSFDGIMVARGDLGVELSPEEVPVWQKTLVSRAWSMGKASIVATQMLESMVDSPRPTRAEASDVANAVIDGTDAVMLSGETAVGSYPVETVSVMARIIEQAEAAYPSSKVEDNGRLSSARAVANAACDLARDLDAHAVVVLTRSGMTARLVSRARPPAPIIALTRRASLARQLALWWGVTPVVCDFPRSTESALACMEKTLVQKGLAAQGDTLIVVGSTPFTANARTNFLKVHIVKDQA
ncbi:MAG: pyruvate kinase [Dehalococcoidia bacterium]